jgi:hypothetical protein
VFMSTALEAKISRLQAELDACKIELQAEKTAALPPVPPPSPSLRRQDTGLTVQRRTSLGGGGGSDAGFGTPVQCYQIIASEPCVELARKFVQADPNRFAFHESTWAKFADGTDHILLGGFKGGPNKNRNELRGHNVLFLASFHNNDTTLAQMHAMIVLLQSFIRSLTVVLPFYPVGTMERVIKEGEIATASTMAQLFSHMPSCGNPMRLMMYDLHTLQNRFYLSGNALAELQTAVSSAAACPFQPPPPPSFLTPPRMLSLQAMVITPPCRHPPPPTPTAPSSSTLPQIPLLNNWMASNAGEVTCIAFPDEGAQKRFSHMFDDR